MILIFLLTSILFTALRYVTGRIIKNYLLYLLMQLNWLNFCGICQLIPKKLWPNTAHGCNHKSTCLPQLQPLCSAALAPLHLSTQNNSINFQKCSRDSEECNSQTLDNVDILKGRLYINKMKYLEISRECRRAIYVHVTNKERLLLDANNLGRFYKYVNRKLSTKTGIGVLKDNNGENVYDPAS